jgi:hypothetical protein
VLTRLTTTKQTTFKDCRCKYHKRFELGLALKRQTMARVTGTAVHKYLETGSLGDALACFDGLFPSTQEEQDAIDAEKATVVGICEGYGHYFDSILGLMPEVKFEIPVLNPDTKAKSKSFVLAGKADGVAHMNGEWWLVEYKTAGSIDRDYVDKLTLDAQITTYCYALGRIQKAPIAGVIYRVMRKPSIKQTTKETAFQYQNRVIEDYKTRPEFYFHEFKLYRDQRDLETYEHELWQLTQDILQCRLTGRWYRNTSRCADWGKCAYMPLCLGQPADNLYIVQDPDIELKEGNENGDSVAC